MDATFVEKIGRPGWVWAISAYYLFGSAASLSIFYLIYPSKSSFSLEIQAYLDSFNFLDFFIILANSIGAILLFLLRKQAFNFFVFAFIADLISILWKCVSINYLEIVGLSGLITMTIHWGILIAVCIYIKKLDKNGILK